MDGLCAVCHAPVLAGFVVGTAEDDDEVMVLCDDCTAVVFPGLRQAMADHCPFCAQGGVHS